MLHEALPASVERRYATSIATVNALEDRAEVTLTDGTQLTADLLVGGDGIHSRVRELVFGPEAQFLRYLGYHTAAFLFEEETLAARIRDQFRILSLPKRQVGLYAMDDTRVAAFFAYSASAPVRPEYAPAELRRAYGDLGWYVPRMLAAAEGTPELYYDVVAQIDMPRWRAGRAVLIGDAAYAVSLLAGQGASLAMAGSYLLAQALSQADVDAALARFEANLKPEVSRKQASGRRMADFFVPPTAFHNWTRDVFLNAARTPALSGLLGWFFAPSLKSVIKPR